MGIALKAVAVAAAATEPALAAQPAAAPSAQAQWSRAFEFHNTSTIPMIFTNQSWPTGIPLGTVVQPGQSLHFEVPYDGGLMEDSYVYFTPQDGYGASGTVQFKFQIVGVANTNAYASDMSGTSGFTTGGVHDRDVYVLDPDGTNLTLDGSTDAHAQQIATALRQLCDDSNLASCRFDVKTEDRNAFGETHQVGISQVNATNLPQLYKKTENDMVGISDSVGVNVSAGSQLFGLINTSVNASYQHQVTASSSYSDEVDMTVAAGDTGWVLDNAPVIRDTGDFTITMGNTTYHLNNVSFDSPDPNREGQWVTCSLHASPQLQECLENPPSGPVEQL